MKSLRYWRFATILAALGTIVFSVLYLRALREVKRLEEPQAHFESRTLLPDTWQGDADVGPVPLSEEVEYHLLRLAFTPSPSPYKEYFLEISDLDAEGEVVWVEYGLLPKRDDTFEVWTLRQFFGAGAYQLDLYGVAFDTQSSLLATYTIEF